MMRALPRTNFHSSRLVRSLSGLDVVAVAASNQALAERLGQWLDVGDAIALFAALSPKTSGATAVQSPDGSGLQEELAQLRTGLIDGIGADLGSKARIKLPQPAADAPLEIQADFSPYRRYYLAHQRDMATKIGQLRARARAVLAETSPRLKQLAELDAALDQALGERERVLLATVPTLLEKRFERLRAAHCDALRDTQQADDPGRWLQPGGWLARFRKDMQDVLLAEQDLRLQAVVGLIEAHSQEVSEHR